MNRIIYLAILLMSVTVGVAQSASKQVRKGNKDFHSGNFNEAEIKYRKALEENPMSSEAHNNLGHTLYQKNQLEAAASKYEEAAAASIGKTADKQAGYYYNLGNALFDQQKFSDSKQAYIKSLILNPNDEDARHNLVLAMIMEQQQQEQQQQEQEQNQDQQEQDQQEQEQQQDQQNQQNQEQQNQDQQQGQGEEQEATPMSKEDAERLLQALEQDEKDVLDKVQAEKRKGQKIRVEKEW